MGLYSDRLAHTFYPKRQWAQREVSLLIRVDGFDTPVPRGYYSPLMFDGDIPERLDLRRLRPGTSRIRGRLSTAGMKRLADIGNMAPWAQVELVVNRDEHGETVIRGEFGGELDLVCQRCLEPMTCPVASQCELVVVASAYAADSLGKSAESLVAEDGVVDLLTLVEDELILGLPLVARHANAEGCQARTVHFGPPGEDEAPAGIERSNPFTVLRGLKSDADE